MEYLVEELLFDARKKNNYFYNVAMVVWDIVIVVTWKNIIWFHLHELI